MPLDHVIYAVKDARAAADVLRDRYGLGAVEGNVHPQFGTRNRIVPLEWPQYLELIEIADEAVAAQSRAGREILSRLTGGDRLLTAAVAVEDIHAVAERVGVEPGVGFAHDAEGQTIAWKHVFGSFDLPFFISYTTSTDARREIFERRRAAARHDVVPSHIAWIEYGGDEERVRWWLEDPTLAVRCVGGEPGPRALGIATSRGEIIVT